MLQALWQEVYFIYFKSYKVGVTDYIFMFSQNSYAEILTLSGMLLLTLSGMVFLWEGSRPLGWSPRDGTSPVLKRVTRGLRKTVYKPGRTSALTRTPPTMLAP